jgi:tRNA modification GTPase
MFSLKNYNTDDTIAALATFPSKSALGVIKISGKKSIFIAAKIFKPAKKKNLKKVKTFTLHYGHIVDAGSVIDEVLVSIMKGPNSYTKEDVVEISSHGGPFVLSQILEIIIKRGARLALPGEFTYRALVNGRIDLLQAEGIASIVDASSQEGLRLALNQLNGEVSRRLLKLKEKIKDLFSRTEAFINFPEDQIKLPVEKISRELKNIQKEIEEVLNSSRQGRILKEGVQCVICGKTNVGKSTLFNRFLREERVIVSHIAGTTRDVVEETINIKGLPMRIYDTAGILEPRDLIEKKAVEKTNKAFESADLVILILDGSRKLDKDDKFLLGKLKERNALVIINKCDLRPKLALKDIPPYCRNVVKFSALKNSSLEALEKAVVKSVNVCSIDRHDAVFLSSYQQDILDKINDSIKLASDYLNKKHTVDFVGLTLNDCLSELGKMSGEVNCQEVLESIFSKFCIGK